MDKRATHRLTGTVDAHPAASVEVGSRAQRPSIDGAGQHDMADLTSVLRAIAAKIDVVLDEKVAAGGEPEARYRPAPPQSPVDGKRKSDDASELPRHALATTVLRISSDGRLDIDDPKHEDRVHEDLEHDDRQGGISDVVSARDAASVSSAPAATDRSDVEDRLRAARERLEARRASMMDTNVGAVAPLERRARHPGLRRTEVRRLVQRLLIGLAIVGASAVVSVLVT